MDGHIDNVDVIDEDQWSHAPWGAEITDGKIYGRGTSDMKGSVTAIICAAARLAESTGKDFAGNICVSELFTKSVLRVYPAGRSAKF